MQDPITYHLIGTPHGAGIAFYSRHGICGLGLLRPDEATTIAAYQRRWKGSTFIPADDTPRLWDRLVDDLAAGRLRLDLQGTPFQRAVWHALTGIPEGETRAYSEIALMVGRPKATRAVAQAVGRNPVAILVPCHRVISRDGGIGGYHWGIRTKQAMLAAERQQA